MKPPIADPADAKLGALLRDARVTPSLPPGFQESVWRRIERAETDSSAEDDLTWFDLLAGWLLRPRPALAVSVLLLLVGVRLGWRSGEQLARQQAQVRYVTAVAPNSLR